MNINQFLIRKAEENDFEKIFDLYSLVSKTTGGIARTENEITKEYVQNFLEKACLNGLQFIVVDTFENDNIIAEVHCYKLEPVVFAHILSELTIVVNPQYQGMGLGKQLFKTLLNDVTENRKDVFRVELIARESNVKAIKLYESLGFTIEGKLANRIKNAENSFEADIPMAWFNSNYQFI